ncbi:MAG TPA: hypothetical protein VER11_21450 [Polyangiaceae bacterium]|nr:hypothetical protein [Polyangiaceae bacterium]
MTRRASWVSLDRRKALHLICVALCLAGCSEGNAQKSWAELSACLAGPAAASPLSVRVAQLRSIALGNTKTSSQKSGWPARCAGAADDLYAALGTSSEGALLKRKLHERLACGDNKGTCTLPTDSSLISIATELWETAASAGLKTEPAAPGIAAPEAAPPALLNAASWKSFSDKSLSLIGPLLTADGRAVLLLKPSEGRGKPRGCEFTAGFNHVSCFDAHADVPDLPAQTVDLVSDSSGVYAAGLTEKGLFAYDLKSGQSSDVRGLGALRMTRDGLAVERGEKDEGYQITALSGGRAGKASKLPKAAIQGDPMSLGDHVVYLQQTEAGSELVAKSLASGRLKDVKVETGAFSGTLHGCRKGGESAVAAYGPRAGLHNAKATAGDGKTQVTVTLFRDGAWTKPSSATIPFARGSESDLVCTKNGASLAYAQTVPDGVLVGRVDCSATGCQSNEVKLADIESKWWWAVGPLGDKLLLMWRSSLGETRLRLAPLASLPTTKDVIVFDAPDFGGPNAGELSALFADNDALLIFRGEKPVALHVAGDGSVRVVTP